MNNMPEVAKMLNVEYEPKEPDFEIYYRDEWVASQVTRNGLGFDHDDCCQTTSAINLSMIIMGVILHRPLPRYTIPSDLEVDAKVWVRMKETEEWRPYHFVEIGICNYRPYTTHIHGYTSHSNSCNEFCHWAFCITDEEYRKRKEGE